MRLLSCNGSAALSMSKTRTAIILALAVCIVGAIFLFAKPSQRGQQTLDTQTAATSSAAMITLPNAAATGSIASTTEQSIGRRVIPDGWREYRNATYHFSLLYPQELSVAERQEGGGAITITFQNVERAEGFQIFIVPYSEAQVSEERFKKDVPSGVRQNLTNVVVDGATGAAFYSSNLALGATREVWFVHKGFLYEATTLKPLEAWFRDILQTWKFL